MKPDLTTLDGQRTATRRGAYIVLGVTAFCVILAMLAPYPEERLTSSAMVGYVGGPSVIFLTTLREMSRRQRWIDAGSTGFLPQRSAFWHRSELAALFLGPICGGILMILSGSLYPHWRHVGKLTPASAVILGVLSVVLWPVLFLKLYKAQLRKT